jgi:pilus assembly protein CpaC
MLNLLLIATLLLAIVAVASIGIRFVIARQRTLTRWNDHQSGRELAVTGLLAATTTLKLWFADKSEPSGESIVSYLVRDYADPNLTPLVFRHVFFGW